MPFSQMDLDCQLEAKHIHNNIMTHAHLQIKALLFSISFWACYKDSIYDTLEKKLSSKEITKEA